MFKLKLIPALVLSCLLAVNTYAQEDPFAAAVSVILSNIHPPQFKNAVFNITAYGAIADGKTDSKAAIDKAIDQCSVTGGGEVLVPKGTFYIAGPVVLKSHVNLHFENGAELVFSGNPKDYLPPVISLWEGTEVYNYSPLLYAYQCSDIAVTGHGIINGSASMNFAKWGAQGSPEQLKLRQMGGHNVPVYQRVFGDGYHLPPDMVQFFGCKNVLIDSITIKDSPYWVIHPVFCNNVTVRDVTINSHNRNNDGCDPESSTNVLIEHCNFDTGDDGIAIKAGRDQDAWRIGQPTENIIVRNSVFTSKANGICIGSEMSAGVRNVYMYNVFIHHCLSAIYFKSNLDRGGFIENVHVHTVQCDTARAAFIRFENNYSGARGGHYPTDFNTFVIDQVNCNYAGETGIYAVGVDGKPLRNIVLSRVSVLNTPKDEVIANIQDVIYNHVTINGHLLDKPQNTDVIQLKTD